MKTVGDPAVCRSLIDRLRSVRPESVRRWGTLTAHEMLCHLGDGFDMVLGRRPREQPVRMRRRPLIKALALWTPVPWPHGWQTNPMHDPRRGGTRPTEFARDLQRVIVGIDQLSRASPETLERAHGFFGIMSMEDWHRWAYKHTDHHLRQFGR
jgi:hypothetical protein